MQAMSWILGTLLLTGMVLVFGDLWRNVVRFREWCRLRAEQEGEIVLGDSVLQAGLAAHFASEPRTGVPATTETWQAYIADVEKKLITLALDQPLLPAAELRREAIADSLPAWPKLGTLVSITVTGEDALYRFFATVRDVRRDARKPGQRVLVVDRPTWMARVQRRQHVRARIQMPAAFERAAQDEPVRRDSVRVSLPGTLIELSAGGFQANLEGVRSLRDADRLTRSLTPGTVLRVRLSTPALAQTPLLARVRSCGKAVVRGGVGVRMACEFLPMHSWEQELIIQDVFRAQRDQLQTRAQARQTAA